MGFLRRDSTSRAIELTEADEEWRHKKILPIPVIGKVHVSQPALANENIETVLHLPPN